MRSRSPLQAEQRVDTQQSDAKSGFNCTFSVSGVPINETENSFDTFLESDSRVYEGQSDLDLFLSERYRQQKAQFLNFEA